MHLDLQPLISLILFSHSSLPHHIACINPGCLFNIFFISSKLWASNVNFSLLSKALLYISFCIVSNKLDIYSTVNSSLLITIFSLVSLLAIVIVPFSKSLAPISILTGIPFTSASANLNPGDFSELSI